MTTDPTPLNPHSASSSQPAASAEPTAAAIAASAPASTRLQAARVRLVLMTPANGITLIRLIIAPFAVWAQQTGSSTESAVALWICLGLMAIGELSDALDGYVARATKTVSDTGKLIDPMCDSVFRTLLFLGFMASHWMPLWMVGLIVARDTFVAYARVFCALNGIVLAARLSGKLKAIIQAITQFGVVLSFGLLYSGVMLGDKPWPAAEIAYGLCLLTTIVTVWSGAEYLIHVGKRLTGSGGNIVAK